MNQEEKDSLMASVGQSLEAVKPFLHKDGGDVELIDISEDFKVIIRLLGACKTCNMSNMTMKNGIEESIKRTHPQITEVIEVE